MRYHQSADDYQLYVRPEWNPEMIIKENTIFFKMIRQIEKMIKQSSDLPRKKANYIQLFKHNLLKENKFL